MRILIVEDQKKMASFIRKALQAESFAVDVLHEGSGVLAAASATPFDVIILDIMLPGRDGLSVLRQLRDNNIPSAVMLLTARGETSERVLGLNAGADDYLPKPFVLAELVARVRALGRRTSQTQSVQLRIGDLVLHTITRVVKRGERVIELTPREYRLLEFLLRTPGGVRSRMSIVESVWDYDFDPGSNLVDVHIMRLREKIDSHSTVKLLHTVRGVGYVLREGV